MSSSNQAENQMENQMENQAEKLVEPDADIPEEAEEEAVEDSEYPPKRKKRKLSAERMAFRNEQKAKNAAIREVRREKSESKGEVAIKFDHVTKRYKLFKNDRERLFSIFWPRSKRRQIDTIKANNNLSFTIKRGEAVALVGANGAGKSTALKMVTGVSFPTKGTVTVNGHVSALLELTAGFDSKLTGRENIYLRGQSLGYSKEQLTEMEPKIVEFADIGKFIDQPVKMYSSGMKARLGFGIAVSMDPEILVVDEALSVGDRKFRKKCYKRVKEIMRDENVTVMFVTHSSRSAKEFCTRGIVLEEGKKMFDGPIDEAIDFYNKMMGGEEAPEGEED